MISSGRMTYSSHTQKFLNKLNNLLVLLSRSEMEYRIISIIKYTNNISKVIGFEGYVTIKVLSIYQYCTTAIYDIIPRIILDFETLNVVQIINQRVIRTINNGNHSGDIELKSGCCQRHQFQYLSKKSR